MTWVYATVEGGIESAERRMPGLLRSGRATARIWPVASAPAEWGERRFRLVWKHGPLKGTGYVELRPASSTYTEATLHLKAAGWRGLALRFLLDADRIARGLARDLTHRVRWAAAAEAPEPVGVRAEESGRIA